MSKFSTYLYILIGLIIVQICNALTERLPFCPPGQETTIFLPHESDCGKFYTCAFGVITEFTCPAGTEFNPDKWSCDWPSPGGCLSTSTTKQTTSTTTTAPVTVTTTASTPSPTTLTPNICPNNNPVITIVPHPEECDKFYVCFAGVPTEYACDSGQEFDPDKNQCVKISESGCFANKQ